MSCRLEPQDISSAPTTVYISPFLTKLVPATFLIVDQYQLFLIKCVCTSNSVGCLWVETWWTPFPSNICEQSFCCNNNSSFDNILKIFPQVWCWNEQWHFSGGPRSLKYGNVHTYQLFVSLPVTLGLRCFMRYLKTYSC